MSDAKRAAKAAAISDFLELGANAFVGGVMVAIALAAITLALASGAQAGALDDATTVLSASSARETRSAAPAHSGPSSAGAGALWAKPVIPAEAGIQPERSRALVGPPSSRG
jgi:hypothetical protein